MEFVKNNLYFLLASLVCLIGIIVVAVLCSGAAGRMKEFQEAAKKSSDYLAGVGKKHIALNDDNVALAESNAKAAEDGQNMMKDNMKKRFRLDFQVPPTPIEALRKLNDEIVNMRKFMENNKVEYPNTLDFFTFERYAQSTQPPHPDDVRQLFRQLTIIKQVLKILVDAKVTNLLALSRPMDLIVTEEAFYTFTPIEIDIQASAEIAQNFVNLMSNSRENYMFVLRNLSLQAPDITTEAGADVQDTAFSGNTSSSNGGRSSGMSTGKNRERSQKRERPARNPDMGTMAGMNAMNAMNGMGARNAMGARNREQGNVIGANSEENLVEVPVKRNEQLVYEQPKEIILKLRFDLIEFYKPSEDDQAAAENQEEGEAAAE